jgi:hypothetical protein
MEHNLGQDYVQLILISTFYVQKHVPKTTHFLNCQTISKSKLELIKQKKLNIQTLPVGCFFIDSPNLT